MIRVGNSPTRKFLVLRHITDLDAATRMETAKYQDGEGNRRKFETAKVYLVRLQTPKETLGRLSESKNGTKICKSSGSSKSPSKAGQSIVAQVMTRSPEKCRRYNNINTHGKDLVR